MAEPVPTADYYVTVSRERRRPVAEVWPVPLRRPLPEIPIPLAGNDPDVGLRLQTVFSAAYDGAGYDYSLDYRGAVEPALSAEDQTWAEKLLAGPGGSGTP
jgi:hypothetical protein